ncbi:hypothetical protein D8X55_03700, partial [Malacoplasma penetrans]|uniref:hypothetical protein n=1 Tax=Malacoplasma penetrans TaxID=28227 RepID=UPI001024B5CC
IWKNLDKYNPKKKNLIWLGDSLITSRDHTYPQWLKEMRDVMQSWLKIFPSNEYNFFAKKPSLL